MVTKTHDHTIELDPLDLLRFVEGDRPTWTIRVQNDTFDGLLCVQMAYNISNEYEYEAGMGNEDMAPVFASRTLQKLLGDGAVRYCNTETDTRFFVVLSDHDGQWDIKKALKQAFYVHQQDYEFGGKDPRRVWSEYTDLHTDAPRAQNYLPIE